MIIKNIHILPPSKAGVILYDAGVTSLKRQSDFNNCVLRALAVATNKPIDEIGDFLKSLGRKYGKGTPRSICKKAISRYQMEEIFTARGSLHGAEPIKPLKIREAISLIKAMKDSGDSRFIIKSRKHWFAVVDGCPVDSWDWLNQVGEYEDFKTPGLMIRISGWDKAAWKIWRIRQG